MVTPDQLVPATTALVQKRVNAGKCREFDLNASCTDFLCLLATGARFIHCGLSGPQRLPPL